MPKSRIWHSADWLFYVRYGVSVFERTLPLEDAEEERTIEVGRALGIEVIPEIGAIGIGGNHQLAVARQTGMQIEHVKMLVSLHAYLIESIWEFQNNFLIFERPPGMLAAEYIEFLSERI